MSKQKRPTSKSVRQGQTVYVSFVDYANRNPEVRTIKIFISGVDVPEGCVMDHASVERVRLFCEKYGDLFYSRRKAISEAKRLKQCLS